MINPKLNMNKAFREQVTKCMNTTFCGIGKYNIITTLEKNNTRVLALLLFYETIKNPEKYLRVLRCVICTIISNYVCIVYLACEQEK